MNVFFGWCCGDVVGFYKVFVVKEEVWRWGLEEVFSLFGLVVVMGCY